MNINNIKYFKVNEFTDEKIAYGFFSRNGGFSKKPYDSLNCSFKTDDDKNMVRQNVHCVNYYYCLHWYLKCI